MTHAQHGAAWLALALGAALLAGCGPSTEVGQAKANTSGTVAGQATTQAAVETTPEPAPPPPPAAGPADFKLSVKILTQQCFGSAGCNLTYRAQIDSGPSAGTYEVSYEVAVPRDENSPYADTLTVTDGKYSEPFEGFASPSRRVKSATAIKVTVTAVESR